ncbi:MAG: FAD-binding oxidoreductase, partial [candidate division WOR-3 bacterium]
MEIEKARLIKKEEVSAGLFIFDLESKAVSRKALPGQFVQIRVWDSFDPFLRRPFSIAQVDSDTFRIAFRIRGKGTKILALTREDDYLDVLGPLGKPIPAYEDRNIVLIGGGVGIAPLLFLAQKLAVKNRLFIFLGARSRNELLFLPDFKQLTN